MNFENTSSNTAKMRQHNTSKGKQPASSAVRREEVNLTDTGLVDLRQIQALNASESGATMAEIMSDEPPRAMVSDVDEQILLKVMLQRPCAITSLHFYRPPESVEDASVPKLVKVYVNHDNMDFQDVEDLLAPVAKELDFQGDVAKVLLSGPNFSRVSSLQVLIESNDEDTEKTVLQKFVVRGHQLPT